MKNFPFLLVLLILLSFSCATTKPQGLFKPKQTSKAPDYSDAYYWAALPGKADMADRVPQTLEQPEEENLQADVFFLYPTIYTGQKGDTEWNAPVDDEAFNQRVDESTILYQASVFNAAGKVYAPRYRQAHLSTYYSKDAKTAKQVFDFAYQDLKAAFEYYLEHYNEGRPIIIAAHSQGTTHGRRLVKEFFDGTPLQDQLIAAYLIGMPVAKEEFQHIPVCQNAEATGCFVSWRTYRKGYVPKTGITSDKIAVVNPLNWSTQADKAALSMNKGGLLRNFDKIHPGLTDAQINAADGILWARKPRFFGNFLLTTKDYHIADLNFYYLNVRENAVLRTEKFLEQSHGQK